jgi:hypothetical protein
LNLELGIQKYAFTFDPLTLMGLMVMLLLACSTKNRKESELNSQSKIPVLIDTDLWWIENGIFPKGKYETFRGVYQGGEQFREWGNIAFVEKNIRGKGTTRGGMFDQKSGDAFPVATWPKGTLKEGDSPSILYLISPIIGGEGDIHDPTQESWGGQFRKAFPEKFPNYYVDLDASPEACQATINKWRLAI